MSEQLVNAIKQKYGVSDEVGQQVVNALVEVEKHRQTSGMRGAQTPDIMSIVGGLLGGGQQQGGQGGGDLMGMVNSLLGGQQPQGNQQSGQGGGDLMGMVNSLLGGQQPQGNQGGQGGGDLMGMVSSLLGGGQPQGGHNMVSILGDLLGGASHPSQAPDLMNIVGGLLGGQGGDVSGMVNNLLGGGQQQGSGQYNAPTQGTLNHPTVQQQNKPSSKPNMGSIGDALGEQLNKKTIHREGPDKKFSNLSAGADQKPGQKSAPEKRKKE